MRSVLLGILFVSGLTVSAIADNAKPVARIMAVSGKVKILSGDKDRAAANFGGLFANEKLELEAGSSITLKWNHDQRVEKLAADSAKTIEVHDAELSPNEGVQAVVLKSKPKPAVLP